MTVLQSKVHILIVDGKDVKAFATLPFLENYCEKNGITQYDVREEVIYKEQKEAPMDNNVMKRIDRYIEFLGTQFSDDTILTATYKVLVYDDMEEARKLETGQFQAVLNNIVSFAHILYDTHERPLKPYARHYVITLIEELTRLNSDNNVVRVLKLIRQYDYEAWEICIAYCSPSVRDAALSAERILRFVRDAIYGSVAGAIVGAIIIAVRMWLKI